MSSPILTSKPPSLKAKSQTKSQKSQGVPYFKKLLKEAGINLECEDDLTPNFITQEQSLVIRDLTKKLRENFSYPNNIQEFIEGLKILCKNEGHFRKALLSSDLKKSSVLETDTQQESLIRMLLEVEYLQNEVIELIMEEVADAVSDESDDTSWLKLLLSPLRYLSHINNSKGLTSKLLDVLEIAKFTAQIEILNFLHEIIPDNEYEETARELSKLLGKETKLTGAIIDCLNTLNLDPEVFGDVQQEVLDQLNSQDSFRYFPILFEFLVTNSNQTNLQNVLLKARNALDTIMGFESSDKEMESTKVVIFNKQGLGLSDKSLYDGWVNLISISEHKPIDLLILFVLDSVGKAGKASVVSLIKKRVKSGMLKVTHLEAAFKNYFVTQILKDNSKAILKIASSLLRSHNEPMLVEFGSVMYKLLFSHPMSDRLERREVIFNLVSLTGGSDKKITSLVLNVLKLLFEDFEKLQEHSLTLMRLLDKLDGVELKDIKIIFEILCGLVCDDESLSGLRDEIHMITRKQLSTGTDVVKRRGIIAAVVMAKSIAKTSREDSEALSLDNTITIDDLRRGPAKDAASLLMLANTCTLSQPNLLGLYYDELAWMVATSPNFDNNFMGWLYHLTTNDFQSIFVTETVSEPINGIEMSMQYSLNTDEEMDSPIAINIGELCLKSPNDAILTLSPLFRLVRILHYKQHDKDLSSIDGLLGCSVIMPDLTNISDYHFDQLGQVADCLFHCINWFREIISAFVTQTNKRLRNKLLERLVDVVKLEEILKKCLEYIPDHKLPLCYFEVVSQSTKQLQPVKTTKSTCPKKKRKLDMDETTVSTAGAASQPAKSAGITKKKNLHEPDCAFREMDTDIIRLLRYPLKLTTTNEDVLSSQTSQVTTLNINQFKFLMKDAVCKLDLLSRTKSLGLSHLNVVKLSDLIADWVRLMPFLQNHLKSVTGELEQLLRQSDGCLDNDKMFGVDANNLKVVYALILKIYVLIFEWTGFQDEKNRNLLKDCLKSSQNETQSQIVSAKFLITEFIKKLSLHIEHCLDLASAVNFIQIMQALYRIDSNPDTKKKITVISRKLLMKPWYNSEKLPESSGKNALLSIDLLTKACLNGASVKLVAGLVETLQGQVSELKTKDDHLTSLAGVNKGNFYVFYRCLCATLLEAVRSEINSLTNNQHLVLWRMIALTMQGLMNIIKIQETKTNLVSFLKNSIGVLKVYLASGIPILEIMMKTQPNEVVEIIKTMQTSTRFLHHLCCHSKYTKDTSLVAYIPQFRLTLESLMYRVKAAALANGCSSAVSIGILRNKDLHGDEIITQSSIATDQPDKNTDDEELPADESENEDEVEESSVVGGDDDEGSDGNSSASDVF